MSNVMNRCLLRKKSPRPVPEPQAKHVSLSTPIVHRAVGSKPFQTNQATAKINQGEMAKETRGYWIGPCPVTEFLDEFLPVKPTAKGKIPTSSSLDIPRTYFKKKTIVSEPQMYEEVINFLNGEGGHNSPAPKFTFVNTSAKPDPYSDNAAKVRPDGSAYKKKTYNPDPEDPDQPPTRLDLVDVPLEMKFGAHHDILEASAKYNSADVAPLEADGEQRLHNRGQIVTYATEICSRQHRTHLFMVFIFHPYARFIRWDRSGIIVSERFNYLNDCSPLVDFFWRYSRLENHQQGHDPTVKLATARETKRAQKYLSKWAPRNTDRPVYKIDVPDQQENKTTVRQFLVWGALAEAGSPLGRATKGWPAVEATGSSEPVFLKEQWRSVTVGSEMETLRKLNDNNVKHVPTLVCGGDLDQHTQSHKFAAAPWRVCTTDVKKEKTIEERIHTRFTVAEVGTVLEKFSSSKQMMSAVYDAFKAHQEAYEKCHFLHRDISGGNILILDDGSGLLSDWDLVLEISQIGQAGRTGERTGTWPFMSIMLLENPYKTHTVRDDLESLFWVVLYYALLYLPHNLTETLDEIVDKVFMDINFAARDGRPRGGGGKVTLINGGYIGFKVDPSLEFTDCHPLGRFVNTVATRLRGWYSITNDLTAARPKNPSPTPEESILAGDPLQKLHADVEDLWKETLNAADWPKDDNAQMQINPPPQRAGYRVSTKHSREEEDEVVNDPDIRVPPSKKVRSSRR